ncbi:dienelactone hydrolase family protein [Corynebacterium pacaense]|uniref:poly(ethylene terephthalate) hydrolase family protein n=1 Tax=Corynebacterium pacaense TaxID=1816684 RepID=UPI0009B9D2B1|nr:dienelactone hydrolase family protein [Corynebacterium pacaense]
MAENLNKHLSKLSKRGPHRVLVGDLNYAGIPGKVYTPAEGNGLPGVAFGHDWMKSIRFYHQTLRHLASWGIVVAAPDTEKGFMPSHRGLAADLESCLQILAGVKLGAGNATVSPQKLGVAGHGMGAGAAILASANRTTVKAVGAIFPAPTSPSARDAARSVQAPGLVIGAAKNGFLEAGDPAKIAANWAGPVCYRELDNLNQQGFSEDTVFKLMVGIGRPQTSGQETVRGLLTGFLLHQLAGNKKYSGFSDPDAVARKVHSYWGAELRERANPQEDSPLAFMNR